MIEERTILASAMGIVSLVVALVWPRLRVARNMADFYGLGEAEIKKQRRSIRMWLVIHGLSLLLFGLLPMPYAVAAPAWLVALAVLYGADRGLALGMFRNYNRYGGYKICDRRCNTSDFWFQVALYVAGAVVLAGFGFDALRGFPWARFVEQQLEPGRTPAVMGTRTPAASQPQPEASGPTLVERRSSSTYSNGKDLGCQISGMPRGAYSHQMFGDIERRWTGLLKENYDGGQPGRVTLRFALYPTGRVDHLKITQNTASAALGSYCQKAVLDCAPFGPWPLELKRLGGDRLDIAITFNVYARDK